MPAGHWLSLLAAAATLLGNCSAPGGSFPDATGDRTALDDVGPVSIYDPARAWNGYTLTLANARIPQIIDMNGKVVHSWPQARVKSRIRLLPEGSLLGIARDAAIVEYDWDGNLIWRHELDGQFPHHDVIRTVAGTTLFFTLTQSPRTEALLEIDREGRVVWKWQATEHLSDLLESSTQEHLNPTHMNSVQEIPPNPWYEAGDNRFRPGNLLVSVRNIDTLVIIDKQTKAVVWSYSSELDWQHEASMNGIDLLRPGNILLFNNGYSMNVRDRGTRVVEIDPIDASIVWEYESEGFYSPVGGLQQHLPNGNVLVSSSVGGRAFEVTREGDIVWEWAPPYEPMRPRRYAYDHCPQLAALGRPLEEPIVAPRGYRFVDRDLYRFVRRGRTRAANVDGTRVRVLKENHECQTVLVPATGALSVGFGLFDEAVRAAGRTAYEVRFDISVLAADGSRSRLFEDTVDVEQPRRRDRTIDLGELTYEKVDLCLRATDSDTGKIADPAWAYWTRPAILTARMPEASEKLEESDEGGLTDAELEVRRRHLEAMGYVN